MHRLVLCLFFASTILLLSEVRCQPDAMLAPPGRPIEFRTPDQLRRYLKALNDYYAIVGRPRFGRSVNKQPLSQSYDDANEQITVEVTEERRRNGVLFVSSQIDFGYFWDDVFKSRDPLDSMAAEDEYPLFE